MPKKLTVSLFILAALWACARVTPVAPVYQWVTRSPINLLWLQPLENLCSFCNSVLPSYLYFQANLGKFDMIVAHGAFPSSATYWPDFTKQLRTLGAVDPAGSILFQSQTSGTESWMNDSSNSNNTFCATDMASSQIPSQVKAWGFDIENLTWNAADSYETRAGLLSTYLTNCLDAADANGKSKNIWFTGNWAKYTKSAALVPYLFPNPSSTIASRMDHFIWMDLHSLYKSDGAEGYSQQLTRLLASSGAKTVIQIGLTDYAKYGDTFSGSVTDALEMIELAQQQGINKFSIYVRLTDIGTYASDWSYFLQSLNKSTD